MGRGLRAVAPEVQKATKPKILIYGKPGVRKTSVSIEFPSVYYFDIEGGATQPQYQKRLKEAKAQYFGKDQGSQDFQTVIDEVETLATSDHKFNTAVFDSFSKLYNLAAASAEAKVGSDYGKDKKEAQKPTKRLQMWLERLDMNCILICHSKDKWGRNGKELVNEGTTFDGWEKLEYDLDLCLEIVHVKGEEAPKAIVRKSRLEGFPMNSEFPWSYEEFAQRAGEATLKRKAEAFKVATPEEVEEATRLAATVKLEDGWVERAIEKAGATSWADMPQDKIQACIKHFKTRLEGK